MRHFFLFIFLAMLPSLACAAETIPPRPTNYVVDEAGVLSQGTIAQLNQQLRDFDNQSSNQIDVAIYPKMQSDSSIDDYTLRIANQWKAGQKKRDNGAILFVFVQDRSMFIQVGSSLEGALPDALCKRIIDEEIAPRFKQKDYDGGITAGVQAMMAATRGEYKGNGGHSGTDIFTTIIIILVILSIISRIRRYSAYGPSGMAGGWFLGSMLGGFGGGGFSGGGGGFSGGGGGFGGGSFGGGGAGGSW